MAVTIQVSVKVLHGDGAVMAHTERAFSTNNPRPRDLGNDADMAEALVGETLDSMKEEVTTQLENWKAATFNILGGGS